MEENMHEEHQENKRQKLSHDSLLDGEKDAQILTIVPPATVATSQNESKEAEAVSATPISPATRLKNKVESYLNEIKLLKDFIDSCPPELTNEKNTIVESDYCYNGDSLIYSTSLPSKPDYNIRWTERVASYYIPSASFTYEVQYSNPKALPLGFTYQWQYIPFSHSNPTRTILCCVVKSVHDNFSNSVIVGDIILKMNEEILIYKPGDAVDYNKLDTIFTETFKSLNSISSIRFLRAGSSCNGCVPSVAEILLLVNEKSAGAKFNVKAVLNKDNQESYGLELIQMDNQLPNAVKKLLQSQKVNWQQIPILSIGSAQANYLISANIQPQMSSIASSVIGSMTLNYTTPIYNVHSASLEEIMKPNSDGFIHSGIYREKSKFVVIYVDRAEINPGLTHSLKFSYSDEVEVSPETPKVYNLGRFDTEEEAKRVFHKVLSSVRATGKFNLKYYLLGLSSKK